MENIENTEISEALPKGELDIQKIGLPKRSSFFTIDPYVSVAEYNQALQALENNGIKYTEFINVLGDKYWYLSLENNQKPIMMNYDDMDGTTWTKVVSKTKPLKSNHIYLLYRRGEKSDISRYIDNDVFKMAKKKHSIVFTIKNKEELLNLSKMYGKIYPLGVYINGSVKLAISFNKEIKNSIEPSRIKLEMPPHKTGELELKINNKVLRYMDKIEKYTLTPYFDKGKFFPTSPMSPLKII
jgi:hypothetical protein